MAALSADFNSYIKNQRAQNDGLVDATGVTYIGGLAQVSSDGVYVAAAASGVTRKIVGQFVKGTTGAETADTKVPVREGDIFLNLAEDGADKPVVGDVGAQVYAASDNEITMRSSGNAKVGILLAIENGGALVRVTQEANL
jgi:hypothetical protein